MKPLMTWTHAARYGWVAILALLVTFVLDTFATLLLGVPYFFAENIIIRVLLFMAVASLLPFLYILFLSGFNFAAKSSPDIETGYNVVGTIYLALAIYQLSIIIKINSGTALILFSAGRVVVFIIALIAITHLTIKTKSKAAIQQRSFRGGNLSGGVQDKTESMQSDELLNRLDIIESPKDSNHSQNIHKSGGRTWNKWAIKTNNMHITGLPVQLFHTPGLKLYPLKISSLGIDETILLISTEDISDFKGSTNCHLGMKAGIGQTSHGEIMWMIFNFDCQDLQKKISHETYLNIADPEYLEILENLSSIEYWHAIICDRQGAIINSFEFKNIFGLDSVLPDIRKAAETITCDFAGAKNEFMSRYTIDDLLNDRAG